MQECSLAHTFWNTVRTERLYTTCVEQFGLEPLTARQSTAMRGRARRAEQAVPAAYISCLHLSLHRWRDHLLDVLYVSLSDSSTDQLCSIS